jgi:hypothetical protein
MTMSNANPFTTPGSPGVVAGDTIDQSDAAANAALYGQSTSAVPSSPSSPSTPPSSVWLALGGALLVAASAFAGWHLFAGSKSRKGARA